MMGTLCSCLYSESLIKLSRCCCIRRNLTKFCKLYQFEISSVIRQKGESQNGCFKKAKHVKISEKHTFLTYVCVSGGKKCMFFRNFDVLCFLETPVLRFALLPYYRRYTTCLEVCYTVSFPQCNLKHF